MMGIDPDSQSPLDDSATPQPLTAKVEYVDPAELVPHPGGPVGLEQREGVFAHSFKCRECQLEFVVMSWVANRHGVNTTFCPECGQKTPKIHWRATLSQSREFVDDGTTPEIFNVVPLGPAELMSDSSIPESDTGDAVEGE